MTAQPLNPESRTDQYPLVAAICVLIVVLLRCAWLCDDAFITFRTVENLWNGHGLVYNVGERVQTYTHPLWMFLLAGVYGISGEFYFSSIALGMLLTLASVWLYVARVAGGAVSALVGITLFIVSKAFIDFSTSGLENPLTHFLLLTFLYVVLRRPDDGSSFARLTFLAALLMLTRMDLALLVAPELILRFVRHFGWATIGRALSAISPFVLWMLFATFYYASPFPNTAYAKLNHSIPADEVMWRGAQYMLSNLTADPLTTVVILIGLALPFALKQPRLIPLAIGSGLYLFYVIRIGGDFMLGRFLTAPFLVGTALLTHEQLPRRTAYCLLLIALVAGVSMRRSSLLSDADYGFGINWIDEFQVCDERAYYYHGTGLLRVPVHQRPVCHHFAEVGRTIREQNQRFRVSRVIGMFAFYAGPDVHVLDVMALSDPLLARLKPPPQDDWRPGHLVHDIPAGYQDTLESGRNVIRDPGIAEYYEHLRLVTRDPLWDAERLRTIWRLNLGRYDHLLENASFEIEEPRYLYPPPDATRDPLGI